MKSTLALVGCKSSWESKFMDTNVSWRKITNTINPAQSTKGFSRVWSLQLLCAKGDVTMVPTEEAGSECQRSPKCIAQKLAEPKLRGSSSDFRSCTFPQHPHRMLEKGSGWFGGQGRGNAKNSSKAAVLSFKHDPTSPGALTVQFWIASPRTGISSKFPGGVSAAGSRPTLEEPLLWTN